VYRHEYEVVDEAQLWATIEQELAPPRRIADAELHS
jgi:hypothetical protein